jgi:hypothetical protein
MTMQPVLEHDIVTARRVLHVVGEYLLAGPQHRTSGTIRLRVTDTGFSTVREMPGTPSHLAVERGADGIDLVAEPGGRRIGLAGTLGELAQALGVDAQPPQGLYTPGPAQPLDVPLAYDDAAAAAVLDALRDGAQALQAFASAHPEPDGSAEEPVLWPEHFDVGIALHEVNYGISLGDDAHPLPYAYVGPWTPREGTFWNEPFGASRNLQDLRGTGGIVEFFETGRRAAE